MPRKFSLAVRERVGVIRRIYWRMTFKIMGGVYSALAAASFFLSEFASAGVQKSSCSVCSSRVSRSGRGLLLPW